MAGLTYWDVPNLETLHQVRLPSGIAPPQPSQQLSKAPACAPTQGRRPCGRPVVSLRPPDAEPGEEQPGHRRHHQE